MSDLGASSTLDGHSARDVADDNNRTAWCEGEGGTGIGEEVTWKRSEGCSFDRIELLAGNFKDDTALGQHARLKRVRVYDREKPEEQALFDFDDPAEGSFDKALNSPEILDLPGNLQSAKELALRIDAIYPGSKVLSACISTLDLK